MLTPVELAALVTATKGSIEIFDKIAGQIRSVLERRPKEEVGAEDRWRYKVGSDKNNIVVTQDKEVIQTLTGDELASKLKPSDLRLVKTFEEKMESDFRIWSTVYKSKDASQDPEVNAKTDEQLRRLILKMKKELVGIIDFLQRIGVHLDDHYMHVRYIVDQADGA
ncbi:MAG TPA: hypothetical protein VKI44_22270 [Acetobacteraceae bacterium]|nr:hypothetical protein [Acetobacteraceae bacterium]